MYNPVAVSYALASALAMSTSPPHHQPRSSEIQYCNPLPYGAGPVPSPDTADAFLASRELFTIAKAASTPSGYTQAYANLHASSTASDYLGFVPLDTYNTSECSSQCDIRSGCASFNIFFERAPLQHVGDACKDPDSTTMIKCVLWGGKVGVKNAENEGYKVEDFEVKIAGSNGYIKIGKPAGGQTTGGGKSG
ncbi:hypothetical protein BU24DRAFT_496203 [Aaosphaeria arxii CBS 175.79]|uniref:Apple domain-containing protein n=1 Tax=Aaosphaeria arxii CBS 175.79 TaxID=1450172 RepID=A0A6A5XFC0_9PLEO|nr:uncharacterized protein BU24DRAFT_496203 [Aaosphaeria arxii CBS 175.79]KAF2011074.1 hypothetical protein BU24DRAFT_496203 [Aaosphaeria arxii CBS 175.79]